MTEPDDRTVFERLLDIQADIEVIEKKERNEDQGFNFRGVDTVMEEVGVAIRKHRVLIIPSTVKLDSESYTTKRGTVMRNVTVEMAYTAYGPKGDSLTGGAFGEAADAGDKAVSKAESVALRVFLLEGFMVPTKQRDPDADSHERSTPAAPPAVPLASLAAVAMATQSKEQIDAAWKLANGVGQLHAADDSTDGVTIKEILLGRISALRERERISIAQDVA